MDRLIYVAMTGATQTMSQQASIAHNLANANTIGYKAVSNSFRAVPVVGEGSPTRAFVVDSTVGSSFAPGSIQTTGRDRDVAVQGAGWIAVQTKDGGEAYTRDGNLQQSSSGLLQTRNGFNVMGANGPISIPVEADITIAKNGWVTVIAAQARMMPQTVEPAGRIKLVNPPEKDLVRGDDGLFRLKDGGKAPEDGNVALAWGALENSNVNVVKEMVSMISNSRQYDMQMKLLENAKSNANQASQILSLRG